MTSADRPPEDRPGPDPLSDSLRWALALGHEPDRSPIDWLAVELDPQAIDAADAILRRDDDPRRDLERLVLLKSGFKTLRIGGESVADRRLAARFYAASIAAGVVRHRCWISNQRPDRAIEAIRDLLDDDSMPSNLRELAGAAITATEEEVIAPDPSN